MKNIYSLIIALLCFAGANAQCVINTAALAATPNGGSYPPANQLPHIVPDSLYDQTVQGRIPDTMNQSIAGFTVDITIDSVRLDSINGLPAGITWIKNPNVLRGGGFGCVEFTGVTSDTPGTYPITAVGMTWVHLSIPLLGVNEDTSQYGSLNRLPQFTNYYLVIDSGPMPLSVITNGRNLCYGDTSASATITANASGGSPTSPYTYLWNTGATTYTVTGLYPGTYSVTVTSGSDTTTATTTIAVDPSAMVLVTSTDSGSTGANGTVAVTVSGGVSPYTYRWTPGGGRTDNLDSLPAGTYHITVTDSFGCRATDTAVVQNLCASFALVTSDSGSTGSNGSAAVAASGGYPPYTYAWSDSATTTGITGLAPGTYRVTVADSKGCTARANVVVQNISGILWMGENAPKISLFPNPANNVLNVIITSKQAVIGRIEVIDIAGRVVYSAPATVNGQFNLPLNITGFSAGIYTLQISSGNQSAYQRFEVAH